MRWLCRVGILIVEINGSKALCSTANCLTNPFFSDIFIFSIIMNPPLAETIDSPPAVALLKPDKIVPLNNQEAGFRQRFNAGGASLLFDGGRLAKQPARADFVDQLSTLLTPTRPALVVFRAP